MNYEIINNDCLVAMKDMESNSIDAIVTDAPYNLNFMGVAWDTFGDGRKGGGRSNATFDQVGGNHHPTCSADQARTRKSENAKFQLAMTPIFEEALRVAKPGAHLLCFGGTRTFHRMACAIEDAGWIVFDCIMWVYGSGFPHGMDVGKKLPEWTGWNTALKPAWEPIIVARKPLDGTVAHNVLTWGVGALNIDACRVPTDGETPKGSGGRSSKLSGDTRSGKAAGMFAAGSGNGGNVTPTTGRFPANLVHDGSQMVLDLFPDTGRSSGGGGVKAPGKNGIYGSYSGHEYPQQLGLGDSGSAARFFYCAKASKKDRGDGNNHPTVKPTELMKWLVKLVTPEGGVVLDPFAGSGSTLVACKMLGRDCIGIEREPEYVEIIKRRLETA